MPNIKSAQKRMRQNTRRRDRNRSVRNEMRTEIKRFRLLLTEEKLEEARSRFPRVCSIIDRTVRKGVIHANTAARYKSRLSKHLREAAAL